MIRQIVLIQWTQDATDQEKQDVATAFLDLKTTIAEVRDIKVGSDLGVRPDNFDFAISVDFDSREDYLAYREDPRHMQVVMGVLRPVRAARVGVTFES